MLDCFLKFVKLFGLGKTKDVLNIRKLIVEIFIEYYDCKKKSSHLKYKELFNEKCTSIKNKISIFISNISNILLSLKEKEEISVEELLENLKKFKEKI